MEAIPVVDLRLLTQAEINALSRLSSSGAADPRRCDDVVVPKIDRSVFNESAGSRKQTYSRLRLAPRKPPDLSLSPSSSSSGTAAARGRRRSGGLLVAGAASSSAVPAPPPLPPASSTADDPGRRENEQIILCLRQLFAKNGVQIAEAPAARDEGAAVPGAIVSPIVSVNPSPVASALGKRAREQEAAEAVNGDREVLNLNGAAVNLVGLGEAEDPFGAELRRRTQGLATEEEFLRFLNGLEGQWGSRRKRRRIVDAAIFGDALPNGWKLLLALKRKEGNVWLHCRRYISPSGKQFISCKEVSSYLLSFTGLHKVKQDTASQDSIDKLGNGHAAGHSHQVNIININPSCSSVMPISAISADAGKQIVLYGVEDQVKAHLPDVLKCQECNLTFADKGVYIQHMWTFHRINRKRRRVGQSIGDGVIIRDGKYECQFCHKMFTERRRYNGHVGIHVKYHDRRLEPVTDEITVEEKKPSSSGGVVSAFIEHSNSVDHEKEIKTIVTEENMSAKSIHVLNVSYPHSNEHVGSTVSDHTFKCCDSEKEKIVVHEISNAAVIGEMKNSFPLRNNCDSNEERHVMQETRPLPNPERNDGSSRRDVLIEEQKNDHDVLIEEQKNDHIMKYFGNEKSSVQEACNAQCIGEIDAGFPISNQVNKVDCFPEINNETSESRFVEIDYGMMDQKPREAVETGNVMNGDMHVCLDCTCPSLTDVGDCTCEHSSRNALSNEVYDVERHSKLNIDYDSNSVAILQGGQTSAEIVTSSVLVIEGAEQSNTGDNVVTSIAEGAVEMNKSDNEPENVLGCANTASDRAVTAANIVHGETQLPGTEGRFLESSVMAPSGRKYCDIDISIDDMLPSTGEEIMFEIMRQSSNELKDDLMSDGTVLGADAPTNDSGIAGEGNIQSLRVNVQASWERTSVHLPIIDMISSQGNDHLHYANGNDEEISCFEGNRFGDIEPRKLLVSAGRDVRQQLDEPIDSRELEEGPSPCIQLEWESAFTNLVSRRRFTTVCVWCSTEFEHDDVDIEVQPDSLGFMCPACKAKISGQM